MTTSTRTDAAAEAWLEIVRRKVTAMRFGSVQIVVHDGRVTQVDCTERTRLPSMGPGSGDPRSCLNPEP